MEEQAEAEAEVEVEVEVEGEGGYALDLSPENWDDTALLRAYDRALRQVTGKGKAKTEAKVNHEHDKHETLSHDQDQYDARKAEAGEAEAEAEAEGSLGTEAREGGEEGRYLNEEWAQYYQNYQHYGGQEYAGGGQGEGSGADPPARTGDGGQGDVWSKARELAMLSLSEEQARQGLADLMASWYCAGYQAGRQRRG
ncbi:hypothetical protein HOP50_16g76650 [Chloropicon primus]|uniref:Survival Motor Neuron Gemin2-binding domain-containing protein n=1 Tax=Chloropicon primus TaxID=1764295 RepID=A0A5B8MWC1_9CHLO|nr:hypothetical protein A3770_16p76360 [Chloropicon primus]UPR04327.1 hypothetical protein HOP50_16g76650 [Chloropicon primus]|eukprot:QDZ25118.1 hypothetical protein A3770_16p76360 [Chloropicon primus]